MIQSWENIALLVRYIADYPEYIGFIMTKALDDSQPENWRAMWMIDKINEKNPLKIFLMKNQIENQLKVITSI